MTSRWPLVTGSKEPGADAAALGHAVLSSVPVVRRVGRSGATVPKRRLAVAAGPQAGEAVGPGPVAAAGGPLDERPRRRRPASRARGRAGPAAGRRRPGRRAGRGTPRRTPGRAGPSAATRSTLPRRTSAPGRPRVSTLARRVRTARGSDSTSRACAAPRLSASRPTAPDPAYRSRTRRPARRAAATRGSRTAPRGPGRRSAGCPRRAARPAAARATPAITRVTGRSRGPAARHAFSR